MYAFCIIVFIGFSVCVYDISMWLYALLRFVYDLCVCIAYVRVCCLYDCVYGFMLFLCKYDA